MIKTIFLVIYSLVLRNNRKMLMTKGPGGGLFPKHLEIVVRRAARIDLEEDYPITWEVI